MPVIEDDECTEKYWACFNIETMIKKNAVDRWWWMHWKISDGTAFEDFNPTLPPDIRPCFFLPDIRQFFCRTLRRNPDISDPEGPTFSPSLPPSVRISSRSSCPSCPWSICLFVSWPNTYIGFRLGTQKPHILDSWHRSLTRGKERTNLRTGKKPAI